MRWLIIFFVLLLVGVVTADGIEIQVENPSNRTYDTVISEEGNSYLGYGLMALGLGVLAFLVFTVYMSHHKKKKEIVHTRLLSSKIPKKNILSWFLKKEKINSAVLSQSHYAKMEPDHEEHEMLQQKKDELMSLKQDILHESPQVLDEEVRRVLKVTDDLLGEIPEDKVNAFVRSPDFEVYKKVMKKVHEPLHKDAEAVQKMQKVLDLFENGLVDGDEARRLLGLPVRHLHIVKTEKKDKDQVLQELKKVRHETN